MNKKLSSIIIGAQDIFYVMEPRSKRKKNELTLSDHYFREELLMNYSLF